MPKHDDVWIEAIDRLEQAETIEVHEQEVDPDGTAACDWRVTGSDGRYLLGGEFSIGPLSEALKGDDFSGYLWEESTDFDRELFPQLRIIDAHPRTGTGDFALIRVQPGTEPQEMWYWAFQSRLLMLKMDLDYHGYLDALLLTMGTFGWQYLYTDIALKDAGSSTIGYLQRMLETFPAMFPERDYSELRERFEQRL